MSSEMPQAAASASEFTSWPKLFRRQGVLEDEFVSVDIGLSGEVFGGVRERKVEDWNFGNPWGTA